MTVATVIAGQVMTYITERLRERAAKCKKNWTDDAHKEQTVNKPAMGSHSCTMIDSYCSYYCLTVTLQ